MKDNSSQSLPSAVSNDRTEAERTAALADLLARVEGAEAGSRELDGEIWLGVGLDRTMAGDASGRGRDGSYSFTDGMLLSAAWDRYTAHHSTAAIMFAVPRVTTSLDASLALCSRVLPTIPRAKPYGPWEWRVHGPNRNDAGLCRAALTWPQTTAGAHIYMVGPVYGATPALAMLAALLTALIEHQSSPAPNASCQVPGDHQND